VAQPEKDMLETRYLRTSTLYAIIFFETSPVSYR